MDRRQQLLDLYDVVPFHQHPLWVAIKKGQLPPEGVIRAEVQHCIRTRAGKPLREAAMQKAKFLNEQVFKQLLDTYLEECTADSTGPSHLELIERLVMMAGVTREQLDSAVSTPGNSAAIALYKDISDRGAGCHMLGAGAVENFYCQLSPKIYDAYTGHYGMSDEQAITYRIHGPMDQIHADRAFSVLDEIVELHGWESVLGSVRDAFIATSLHYDGMYQAATGNLEYWNGRAK
jgi:pyrroloquinoline quinone (PQQ) biosynthesis protein C